MEAAAAAAAAAAAFDDEVVGPEEVEELEEEVDWWAGPVELAEEEPVPVLAPAPLIGLEEAMGALPGVATIAAPP